MTVFTQPGGNMNVTFIRTSWRRYQHRRLHDLCLYER